MTPETILLNLPLYARVLDSETSGILEHICNAIQPSIDEARRRLDQRAYQLNPELALDFLDYLANFAGLSNSGASYLGLGLNPDWDAAWKRRVIQRAPAYWVAKGSEWGIREAIFLWLGWDAHSDRLTIFLPFGKEPGQPPAWWGYSTPYYSDLNRTALERQRLGCGDYSGVAPIDALLLSEPGLAYGSLWSRRIFQAEGQRGEITTGSALSAQRPWQQFKLNRTDWGQIFPEIVTLNPQIWNTGANPEAIGVIGFQPVDIELIASDESQYTTEVEYITDGYKYNWLWPYPSGVPITRIETTTEVSEFGIFPGAQYFDCWPCLDYPVILDRQWRSTLREITTITEEIITEISPCATGVTGEVQVGTETQTVGYQAATPPNQLAALNSGWTITPIDLTEANGLDLTGAGGISMAGINGVVLNPSVSILTSVQPFAYWLPPITITEYHTPWSRLPWYGRGAAEIPGTEVDTPIYEQFQFCNIPANWSRRIIEQIIENRIPITDSPNLFETFPLLADLSSAQNWKLLVETDLGYMLLPPATIFWQTSAGRSQTFELTPEPPSSLFLEFAVIRQPQLGIVSHNLLLKGKSLDAQTYPADLALPSQTSMLFQFTIPVSIGSSS